MKSLLVAILSVALCLTSSVSLAAEKPAAKETAIKTDTKAAVKTTKETKKAKQAKKGKKDKKGKKEKEADPTWMYVLVSDKGKIVKSGENHYYVRIKRKDITNIMMFSDQPTRITKHIDKNTMEKNWKVGISNFDKKQPDAAIYIDGETQIVQVTRILVSGNYVEFTIKQHGNNKINATKHGQTMIFIDMDHIT